MDASSTNRYALRWVTFLLVVVAGLFYVKWFPYYNRAFVAAANHSIGPSILMGTAAAHRPRRGTPRSVMRWRMAKRFGRRWYLVCCSAPASRHFFRSIGWRGCSVRRVSAASRRRRTVDPQHDVHMLRGARRRRAARTQASPGGGDRILARQYGVEPGDARLHGFCSRLELDRACGSCSGS